MANCVGASVAVLVVAAPTEDDDDGDAMDVGVGVVENAAGNAVVDAVADMPPGGGGIENEERDRVALLVFAVGAWGLCADDAPAPTNVDAPAANDTPADDDDDDDGCGGRAGIDENVDVDG